MTPLQRKCVRLLAWALFAFGSVVGRVDHAGAAQMIAAACFLYLTQMESK